MSRAKKTCICGEPVLGAYCEDPIACQARIDKALDPGVNPITGLPNPERTVTPGFGSSWSPDQHARWATK